MHVLQTCYLSIGRTYDLMHDSKLFLSQAALMVFLPSYQIVKAESGQKDLHFFFFLQIRQYLENVINAFLAFLGSAWFDF